MRLGGSVRDPAWLAVVLVCGAAILSIATMAASRFLIPNEDAGISSEAWPWTADGVGVQPFDAASAFRLGDVVVAVDGRPLADWATEALEPPWLLGSRPLGSTAEVEVLRDGQPVTITASLQPLSVSRLGGAPVALVAFAFGAILLALTLVARRPRVMALRLIAIAVACDIADIVAWETGLQPTDLVARTPFLYAFGFAAVFSLIFWAALLHLLLIYPVRARWLVREPRAIGLVYGVPLGALLLGAVVAWLAGGNTLTWLARLGPLTAALVSAMIVAVLAALVADYRRTPAPRRSQVRLLAVTLFVAAAAILLLTSLPIALGRPPLASRGAVALLALPVIAALALAVLRDRLFQVDLLVTSRARIVAAREEERLRLRRELHDGIGPTLAALGLKIDAARAAATGDHPAAAAAILDEMRGDVRAILTDVRGLARDLRPPAIDTLGLVGGLRQQVESMTVGGPTDVEFIADDLPELPAGIEVAAYRIVIEAVTNVIRHAGARTVVVWLTIDHDQLRIEVDDDGIGVDDRAIGVGTRAMYERAAEVGGELTIEQRFTGGTNVTALLPIGRVTSLPEPSDVGGLTAPTVPSGATGRPLE